MSTTKGKKYPGIYRARVLATDAAETDKLGRIKVEVYPFMLGTVSAKAAGVGDGIITADFPWAIPAPGIFSGSGDGTGSFAVPDIDSYVWVFFEEGDVYQPVYFAEAPNKLKGLPTERLVGYPDTKVWKTAAGIVITIRETSGSEDVKVLHSSGTYIQIDSDGNVNIVGKGNVNVSGTIVNINP